MKLRSQPSLPGALAEFWRGLENAYRLLFEHEEQASLRKHIRRGEARVVLLAEALKKITREIGLYSRSANQGIRGSVLALVKECEARLKETEYIGRRPSPYKRQEEKHVFAQSEADHVDRLTERLAETIEKMLGVLREVKLVIRPIDAYRARRTIQQSEIVLMICFPKKQRGPTYYRLARIHLHKTAQVLRRLAVGLGPIPLVFLFDRHVHPEPSNLSSSARSIRPRPAYKRNAKGVRAVSRVH